MRTLLQPFSNRTTLNLFPFYGTVNGKKFLSSTVSTDVLIVIMHEKNKTESSLSTCISRNGEYVVIMHVWSRALGQTCLSLFGGFCSQTLPPSNYMYIKLSSEIDASPALGCLHGLSSTDYGKGERVKMSTCHVGVSRNFGTCAYLRCALYLTRHI